MCEYCEGKYGSDLLIKGNESVFIDVSKTRLELVKSTRDGYGLVTFDSQKINYCPVCGRKLEDKMTKIKLNDGLTRYIATESYTFIKKLIWDVNLRGEKIIEITDVKEGNVLINIDSIFTVEEIEDGKSSLQEK